MSRPFPHSAEIRSGNGPHDRPLRVAVVEEHEILRRGLIAALAEDPRIRVVEAPAAGSSGALDVAVVSDAAARSRRFPCPIVLCAGDRPQGPEDVLGNAVAGIVDGAKASDRQLWAAVHAAALGLRVASIAETTAEDEWLSPHGRRVLELLAEGNTTREIAERLNYSERTIKNIVRTLGQRLDARTRAQLVARAIRRGLI